jgi:subfamily B ATP-binding cassette protein MsbA
MFGKIKEKTAYFRELLKAPEPPRFELSYRDAIFFTRFARPVWKLAAVSLLLTVLTTGLGSLLPLSGKVLIDFVVMKEGLGRVEGFLRSAGLGNLIPYFRHFLGSLDLVVLSVLVIGFMVGATGMLQKYLFLRFQHEVTFNLQTSLFNHLLRFPLSFYRKRTTGYLMSRVSDDISEFQAFFSQSVVQIATKFFYVCFGIAIVFALSFKLAIVLTGILPVYALINYFFAGRLRSTSDRELESAARVTQDIQEVLSGVETVKAYFAEEKEGKRVSGSIRSAVSLRVRRTALYLLSQYSVGGVQFLLLLFIMWLGINEITRGRMTVGDYVAFTSYVVYLSGAIKTLSVFHIMLQPAFASMGRLSELFRFLPEFREVEGGGALAGPDNIRGEIRFDDVSFSYEEGRPILEGISFTARPGEIVALVGASGAGKTTLINLILRFYPPGSGAIYLDGLNIEGVSPGWLRQQIGAVSQEIFLFNASVESNIKYGCPGASRRDVMDAARKAGIHDDIMGLPDAYDAEIGERGATLSEGQRQRLSIARAFLKKPPILVLDEPASALDALTESMLKGSIKELTRNKTTFIISHRLSLADIASRIIVLEGGRIAESGTPRELVRKGGIYCRLLEEQKPL